ncbi:hypothetical protein MNB_SM-4-1235 [hydrothermal vent metagenome]|uniref:SAF domain-containing protein n=1 Tax=hydrothermal vent metagenome TaxID=652676 RepID=A0A1W1CLY6_9ZZZZ
MKNRKHRILIVILMGMVLFSSSLALLMYSKQNKVQEVNETFIEVFTASKTLKKGSLIGGHDIVAIKVSKAYMPFTPLTQSEIISRYTSVDILAGEQFRKEKISLVKPQLRQTTQKEISTLKEVVTEEFDPTVANDMITLPLSLFRNIDNTLKKGDYIDILSIKNKNSKNKETSFETKYIAVHISIDSFVHQYQSVTSFVSLDDDEKIVMADSVVFEMNPRDIKNLLSLYYKAQELNTNRVHNINKTNSGHLWMVKCSKTLDASTQKKKKKMLADYVVPRRTRKNSSSVRISYEK